MRILRRLLLAVGVLAVLGLAVVGAVDVINELFGSPRGSSLEAMPQAAYMYPDVYPEARVSPPIIVKPLEGNNRVVQLETPPAEVVHNTTWFALISLLLRVVGVIVLGAVVLLTVGAFMKKRRCRRSGNGSEVDDVALMQDIHRGLTRMEQRIEALETILLERSSRVTLEKH